MNKNTQQFPLCALYMVATPIGNLADISLRAIECLKTVDAIAAEDTRMAQRLLNHWGIAKPCFTAHQHNERHAAEVIVARLQAGERIAYLSDAGTPAISDPGGKIVQAVDQANLRVIPIPGASALTCALSVAGLAPGPWHFLGFLPPKQHAAQTLLQSLCELPGHLIFYEAPHRVLATVDLLARILGPQRRLVIARELTKLFETIHSVVLAEARAWLEQDSNRQRGEFVLIVEGREKTNTQASVWAETLLARLLPVLSLREAVEITTDLTQLPRKVVYARALEINKGQLRSS